MKLFLLYPFHSGKPLPQTHHLTQRGKLVGLARFGTDGKAEHVLFDLGHVGGKRGSQDVDHDVCTQLHGQVPLTIYSSGHGWGGLGK